MQSKETLEEAAELYLENVNTKVHKDLERDGWMKIGFIGGAKWQQEQDWKKIVIDESLDLKDLEYWKNNAEEDYMTTPISVLRYISELEEKVERLKI